jgi:hypothetical protein
VTGRSVQGISPGRCAAGRDEEELMKTGIRAGVGALMLAALAAIAGCGSGSTTPTVASLGGHGASHGSSASLTQSQSDADMVSFARCMRTHGVQMSDPFHRPGHDGLSIDIPPRDAATASAFDACDHFLAPIVQMKEQHGAVVAAPVLPALTRYAECMRAHNIDMLDPTPYGALSLGRVPGITADFGRYSPQFRAADSACRHLLPASIHDDGTGP